MSISTVEVDIEHTESGVFITVKTAEGVATIGPLAPNSLSSNGSFTGVIEEPKLSSKPIHSAKRRRRRSMRQEEEIAERLGGNRVKGSGAGRNKGDTRDPGTYRLEAKYTTGKAYSLNHADLSKIRGECTNLEVPMFEIHFVDRNTLKTYDRWLVVDARYIDAYQLQENVAANAAINYR